MPRKKRKSSARESLNNGSDWLEPKPFDRANCSHNKLCEICNSPVIEEISIKPLYSKAKKLTIREAFKLKHEGVKESAILEVIPSKLSVGTVGYCIYCNVVAHVSCMCLEYQKSLHCQNNTFHLPDIMQKQSQDYIVHSECAEVMEFRKLQEQLINQDNWICEFAIIIKLCILRV